MRRRRIRDRDNHRKRAKKNPGGFDKVIAILTEAILLSPHFTEDLRDRQRFIRKTQGYARQVGADFSNVWPNLAVYILEDSEYSVLSSMRRTEYYGKQEVIDIIKEVVGLYRAGASPSEFKTPSREAAALYRRALAESAEPPSTGSWTAANAANAAHWAAEAALWPLPGGVSPVAAEAVLITATVAVARPLGATAATKDYAEKLLDLMRKAAPYPRDLLEFSFGKPPEWADTVGDLTVGEALVLADKMMMDGEVVADPESMKRLSRMASKRNPRRRIDDLIEQCQANWEHYLARPGKKRLRSVLAHLEVMKPSKSAKVRMERRRCLRVANGEAKELGL